VVKQPSLVGEIVGLRFFFMGAHAFGFEGTGGRLD
jgi:hypothetical protein